MTDLRKAHAEHGSTSLRLAAEMALEALDYEAREEPESIWIAEREALRQALAQPEQEPLGSEWVPCMKLPVIVHVRNQRDGETHISTREGITPVLPDDLIMRGVAGEEYPIGRELFERTYTFDVDDVNMSEECVHKSDKREHEPVCFLMETAWNYEIANWGDPNGLPVYTAPPKKEWVGLTDEEKNKLVDAFYGTDIQLLEVVEAKLKEKNT